MQVTQHNMLAREDKPNKVSVVVLMGGILFVLMFGFLAIWDAQMSRAKACSKPNQESLGGWTP